MAIHFVPEREISVKVRALVDFDQDSILQVVGSNRRAVPPIWVADPDQYESDGRILRDSATPRLLAYSREHSTLYATDGCNSCSHQIDFHATPLLQFSQETDIGLALLEKMAALVRAGETRPEQP